MDHLLHGGTLCTGSIPKLLLNFIVQGSACANFFVSSWVHLSVCGPKCGLLLRNLRGVEPCLMFVVINLRFRE